MGIERKERTSLMPLEMAIHTAKQVIIDNGIMTESEIDKLMIQSIDNYTRRWEMKKRLEKMRKIVNASKKMEVDPNQLRIDIGITN